MAGPAQLFLLENLCYKPMNETKFLTLINDITYYIKEILIEQNVTTQASFVLGWSALEL